MRVLSVRESLWLNIEPPEVWQWIDPVEDWASWNRSIRRSQWRGPAGWEVGHRFELVAPWGLLSRQLGGRVVHVEPSQRVRWEGRFLTFPTEFVLEVASEGCGSRVGFGSHYRGMAARLAGSGRYAPRIAAFHRSFLNALRTAGERVAGRTA